MNFNILSPAQHYLGWMTGTTKSNSKMAWSDGAECTMLQCSQKTLRDMTTKKTRYQLTCPASFHRRCPVHPQSAPPSAAGCQYWWPQNSPSCQCQHCNTIHQHFTWCWCSKNSPFCHCQHYNTITSHEVYAHKTARTANANTTAQLLHMTFMLLKTTAHSANASTTTQLLHMMVGFF